MSVNKIILLGRIGKDAEKFGKDGAKFSLATSESWKDKATGEKKEKTEWHNVVANGKLADIALKYFTKGKELFVEGRLTYSSKDDLATGKKVYFTNVVMREFSFVSGQKSETKSFNPVVAPSMEGDSLPF